MRTLRSLSTDLAAVARELATFQPALETLVQDAAERGATIDRALQADTLAAAIKQTQSAALTIALLSEYQHAIALERCALPCRCPHDFGEHLAEAPHSCDAVDVETGDDGQERLCPCACPGFESPPRPAADTVPAASLAAATTPAPALCAVEASS